MSDGFWEIILNEAGSNLIDNPSIELGTTGYTAVTGSVARGSVPRRGKYGLSVTPNGGTGAADAYFAVDLTSGVTYTFSIDIKGTAGEEYSIYFTNVSNVLVGTANAFIATGEWQRVEVTYAESSTATRRLHLAKTASADTAVFYSDGWQCEAKAYSTTYIDGGQDGCKWLGAPHASLSSRDGQSRAGGRPYRLSDYSIYVNGEPGAGMPPVQIQSTAVGAGDGSYYQGTKIMPRTLTLNTVMEAETRPDWHIVRRRLVDLVNPRSVFPQQPFLVRYTGNNGKILQSRFVYEGGGEMQPVDPRFVERPPIRIVAHDPFWYEDGNDALTLSSISSVTFTLVAGKVDGTWRNFGPPDPAGTYTEVLAVAIAPQDRYVYFGGDFLNFGNVPAADYFAVWDRLAEDWDDRFAFNGIVRGLAVDANGDIYAVGSFTTIDGAGANRVAVYSGGSWSALGTGLNGVAHAVAIGTDGNIYVGGEFTTAGGVTVNRVAAWNKATSTWLAMGGTPGVNGTVRALAVGPDGNLYVGGDFTTAGGSAAVRIALWTSGYPDKAWFPLGAGVNGQVSSIVTRPNGDVYVGGAFTSADGNSISGITRWNGQTFLPLGLGIDALPQVLGMAFTADGLLWVVGLFSEAGVLQNIGRIATWNGSEWQQIDADLPFVSGPNAIAAIDNNVYIGLDDDDVGTYGTIATLTNPGSWAYPIITVKREGGDSCELRTIINETTGAKLLLSYNLLDGEELTIDLRPGRRMMHSSIFGTRWKLQGDSDVQDFVLVSGDNDISIYTLEENGPTITAHLQWTPTYISAD